MILITGVHGYQVLNMYVGMVSSAGTKVYGTIDQHTLTSASNHASELNRVTNHNRLVLSTNLGMSEEGCMLKTLCGYNNIKEKSLWQNMVHHI